MHLMTMCHRCSGNVNMRMIQDSNMYQCCKDNIAICKLHHRDSLLIQVFPLWGASPDGFCSCDCCGERIIEIKCQYSMLLTVHWSIHVFVLKEIIMVKFHSPSSKHADTHRFRHNYLAIRKNVTSYVGHPMVFLETIY